MPEAPIGIHDVASMSVQSAVGVGQPQGQAAVRSSMGAWEDLLRLLGNPLALERSWDAGLVRWVICKRDLLGYLSLSCPIPHKPLPVQLSSNALSLHKVHLF